MLTKKRYEAIFSTDLQAIKQGQYQSVHYICPNPKFAARLKRLFDLIESVSVAGERVKISDKHRAKLPVFNINHWPPKP